MKGKHIYEEIKKLEGLKEELYQALIELDNAEMGNSRASALVEGERTRVTKELNDALNKEWVEAPTPKFEDIF